MILEPKKIKSATVSTSPSSICHEVMGLDAMNVEYLLVNSFLNIEFKVVFHLLFSLRGSLALFCFLLLGWCHLHSVDVDISPSNLDSNLGFMQSSILNDHSYIQVQ